MDNLIKDYPVVRQNAKRSNSTLRTIWQEDQLVYGQSDRGVSGKGQFDIRNKWSMAEMTYDKMLNCKSSQAKFKQQNPPNIWRTKRCKGVSSKFSPLNLGLYNIFPESCGLHECIMNSIMHHGIYSPNDPLGQLRCQDQFAHDELDIPLAVQFSCQSSHLNSVYKITLQIEAKVGQSLIGGQTPMNMEGAGQK